MASPRLFLPCVIASLVACGQDATSPSDPPPSDPPPSEPAVVTLARDTATLVWVGETVQLEASVIDQFDAPFAGASVTWRSTAEAVASVSPTGEVTALDDGTASIVATAGAAADTAEITVSQVADSIAASVANASLEWIDETVEVDVEVWDQGGTPIAVPEVSWNTSDPSVAEVSARGVVFARGAGEAVVTAVSGSAQADVAVSVVGKGLRILFAGYQNGDTDIYLMNEDGSEPTNLTMAPGSTELEPAARPDGSLIAYISDQAGPGWDIYTMLPDGSGVQNLSNDPGASHLDPTWSPDGQRIAFTRGTDSLSVMDFDGGNAQWLGILGRDPSWSPDGSRIAYILDNSLHVADADGSNPTDISVAGWQDLQPGWAPDGTRIIYSSRPSTDDDFEIYTVAPDASDRVQLTDDPYDYHDRYPAWSPRGHRIVFRYSLGSVSDTWLMDPDGSDRVQITDDSIVATYLGWLLIPPP